MNKKIFFAGFILMGIWNLTPAPFGQAEEDTWVMTRVQTIDGSLVGVNEDNNTIDVRWMADQVMMKYQDVTLHVPSSAAITKNARPIEFRDLEKGDHATVRFHPNTVPQPTVASIAVVE